jgi:uncharacterized protein
MVTMRVLVQVTHPAHVHFFRPFVEEARASEHSVRVIATNRNITSDLLERYGIEHEVVLDPAESGLSAIRNQSKLTLETYRAAKAFDPDVLASIGGTSIAHVSKLVSGESAVFYDTEHATVQNAITYPFADRIYTPACYQGEIGSNHVRYPGYQELAYLHPNRFTPDPTVKAEAGLDGDERFAILRTVSWGAIHDLGDSGFANVADVVSALEATGVRVLITSEAPLPAALERYRAAVEPHRMHHLMHYADLYVGESATMATESAVVGTPAVFISSSRRGYTDELESRYGMVFNYDGTNRQQRGLRKALELLDEYDESEWRAKRERILDEKIDTTELLLTALLGEGAP